jgi:hypothetical protein
VKCKNESQSRKLIVCLENVCHCFIDVKRVCLMNILIVVCSPYFCVESDESLVRFL